MGCISSLITDKTKILDLNSSTSVKSSEKEQVLDLSFPTDFCYYYMQNMYFKNNTWYYFKADSLTSFSIMNEFIGSYLSKLKNLPTVTYEVSKVNKKFEMIYGISSVNFKNQDSYKYFLLPDLIEEDILYPWDIKVIESLKKFAINSLNEKQFLKQIFDLLAIDIYMAQNDRTDVNLQLQVDKSNDFITLAPIYDYFYCDDTSWFKTLKNVIISLNNTTITKLIKEYPEFKVSLESVLSYNIKEILNQICNDYYFNQDCLEYNNILDYYKIKDEKQKEYINSLIK